MSAKCAQSLRPQLIFFRPTSQILGIRNPHVPRKSAVYSYESVTASLSFLIIAPYGSLLGRGSQEVAAVPGKEGQSERQSVSRTGPMTGSWETYVLLLESLQLTFVADSLCVHLFLV